MSLPGREKRSLDLEKDLLLTQDDFEAIRALRPHNPEDLSSYLDFLDELWGSGRNERELEKWVYAEPFQL